MTERALADLHRHIDGSLRRETLEELAAAARRRLPHRLRFSPGMGLDEALAKFRFVLDVMQSPDAVRRVTAECCEDAAREGVTTLELRFAPQLHRGGSIEQVVDAALEGADGRAGIILCGLYGEHPEVLDALVDAAAPRPGVVGIDLAGGPTPAHRFIMEDYAPAFTRARDLGLGRTVHAGEGRPPEEIAIAVEVLHAQRIGHGTTLLEEPEVLRLVREREVLIEACPTSNVHTGAIDRFEDHPLPLWLREGVRACVCSDNTLFSGVDAASELAAVRKLPGIGAEEIEALTAAGHAGAFRRAARARLGG